MLLEVLELDAASLLAAAFSPRQLGLFAVIAAVCAMLLISQRRRARNREPSTSSYARELRSQMREQGEHHRQTAELAIDLEDIARRITAEVDTRFMKLETVIRHADERIEQLEHLLHSDSGNSPREWIVDDQSGPTGEGEPMDSQAKVIALIDAGLSESDIARRLKLQSAEVELILSMRRARTAPASSSRSNSVA